MIAALAGLLLVGVVGVVVASAVMGWGARVTRWQRFGLIIFASGLTLAAPARYFGQAVGLPDLMMLAGLFIYLLARNAKYILRRADALDGREDGRLSLGEISTRRK